jgi:hypothetical protein
MELHTKDAWPKSPDRVKSSPAWLKRSEMGYSSDMGLFLLVLLLALIFAGAGFALHILWIVAVVLLVAWLIGLVLGAGRS